MAQIAHVIREYCYSWTCKCGHTNRHDDIKAGNTKNCEKCGAEAFIQSITYDNGCFVQVGT